MCFKVYKLQLITKTPQKSNQYYQYNNKLKIFSSQKDKKRNKEDNHFQKKKNL